ncbi:hypothetical protein Pla52n_53880 [Stieleria varia]|uniref:Uncharacterized protein n=1 Tax=Stieleria varia TaxID=2528005 RepID=A0A5C6A5B4_9BACT|nr:hypothetical protein Pla52n_53880 [Stieleria varia]
MYTPSDRRLALHDFFRRKYVGFVAGTAVSILAIAIPLAVRNQVVDLTLQSALALISLLLFFPAFLIPQFVAEVRSSKDPRLRCPNCGALLISTLSALRRFSRRGECDSCNSLVGVAPEIRHRTWMDLAFFAGGMTAICLGLGFALWILG